MYRPPGIALIICLLSAHGVRSQDNAIIVFEPSTGRSDTIPSVPTTDTLHAYTSEYRGILPGFVALEDAVYPEGFRGPGGEYPPHAASVADLTAFPFRVNGAIRYGSDTGTYRNGCSGQLVSPVHVLTARHCVRPVGSAEWRTGPIYFAPVFDQGALSDYGMHRVIRYYAPVQLQHDIALLELDTPIGDDLGWGGIGFQREGAYYAGRIHYKFGYPAREALHDTTIRYNGDTMYHFSMHMQKEPVGSMPSFLKPGWNGVPGESGGGAWHVYAGEYQVHAIALYAGGYRHGGFTPGYFQQFRTIIDRAVERSRSERAKDPRVLVFPNPANGPVVFKLSDGDPGPWTLVLCDAMGRTVHEETFVGAYHQLGFEAIAAGMYPYRLYNAAGRVYMGRVVRE